MRSYGSRSVFAVRYRDAADRLIRAALADSTGHRRLGVMVDGFGNRLSGSVSLARAIDWIPGEMRAGWPGRKRRDACRRDHGPCARGREFRRGDLAGALLALPAGSDLPLLPSRGFLSTFL